jgi:hypothetical protein
VSTADGTTDEYWLGVVGEKLDRYLGDVVEAPSKRQMAKTHWLLLNQSSDAQLVLEMMAYYAD